MIDVHLFGKLRAYAGDADTAPGCVVRRKPRPDETVASLLDVLGISPDEVFTVFVNHKLLAARNTMAHWLGYRQVRESPFDWNLDVPVKSGDRVGLFGREMSQLVV